MNDTTTPGPPADGDGHAGFSPDALLQATFLAGDHPVLLVDSRSRIILACNAATERVFGYRSGELVGQETRILHVDDKLYEDFGENSCRVLMGGTGSYHCHYWMRRKDGHVFPSEHLVQMIEGRDGIPNSAISIVRDVSEHGKDDAVIGRPHPGEASFQSLSKQLPGMVYQYVRTRGGEDRYTFLSGTLFRDHGIDMDAVRAHPQTFFDAIHADDRETLTHEITRCESLLTPIDRQVRLLTPDGNVVWLRMMSQPRRLDDGATAWDGFALDITREKKAEERLHYLATNDSLTGLPNQLQFMVLLDRMIRRAEADNLRVAVAHLDIDRMVYINETYGFDSGDELLRRVGRRLQTHLLAEDLVARAHSDTFLVALEVATDDADVSGVLRSLRNVFDQLFEIGDDAVRIGVRIGLALYPADGETGDELLRASGIALDRAKRQSERNYEFYAEELGWDLRRRMLKEQALRDAIEARQFIPHFQPQVSLRDGLLVGLEALARWQGPDGTLGSPADFITLAEETGLIVPLGEQILDSVLEHINQWARNGLEIPPIAINCSARQFRRADFERAFHKRLLDAGVDPTSIVLELTESSLLEDFPTAEKTMRTLAEHGTRFAIDDFGTGFSSLSYLARLPFHTLKIDRSFISAIETDTRQRAITESLILLSRGLGLRVVAEGVETAAQEHHLVLLGCDAAQGFLYAPALPADQVEDWLNRVRLPGGS